jgi:putative endonuclease
MLSGRLTHATIRILDWMASRILPPDTVPPHLRTGRRGEEDAYFHLRKLGYVMVASNFRAPNRRGEIDLIGWHQDILCFVEVKTRTTRDGKPAEAAVDRDKRRELLAVAREYLRHLPPSCPWRLDVISVYYDQGTSQPQIELFRNVHVQG